MHTGHRNRVKERFRKEGLSAFADHEVLELLLFYAIPRGDTNPTAHRLLERFSTPDAVFNASMEELCKVDGINQHSATLIQLIPEIVRYYSSLAARNTTQISNTQDAGRYVCSMIGSAKHELFCVLCLDAQKNVLAFEILEEGTVSQANVHPRKVAEFAFRHSASAVILAHNHPAGGAYASEDDRMITAQLCTVLEAMDIAVIDHIIAASADKFVSMADSGLMPN